MGIGPTYAAPRVLGLTGLSVNDVGLLDAFASMYVYCVRKLGLDPGKVNVNGSAIALGHPLARVTRLLLVVL
ncbi:thiolase [Gautieria morchelliformis]|nr:thiolase [Gautieria morchelliformis]